MNAPILIQSAPIDEIGELAPEQYVGLIDEAAIECLVARIAVEGLHTPIWVRRNGNAAKTPWSVIAGRHRLLAVKRLGWTVIQIDTRADAASGVDVLHRLQVAENLDRRVLRPIERALNVMVRWRGEIGIGALDTVSKADADSRTATVCGTDERTIRRYRRLHETIIAPFPDLFPHLNAHAMGESLSAMTSIAQIKEVDSRRALIKAIIADPELRSVDEAKVRHKLSTSKGHREKTDYSRQVASILQRYKAVDIDHKRAAIADIASHSCVTALEYMIEQATAALNARNAR